MTLFFERGRLKRSLRKNAWRRRASLALFFIPPTGAERRATSGVGEPVVFRGRKAGAGLVGKERLLHGNLRRACKDRRLVPGAAKSGSPQYVAVNNPLTRFLLGKQRLFLSLVKFIYI